MKADCDNFINRTISYVKIKPAKDLLKLEEKNIFLGSCFSENLYTYFISHYLNCIFSPFGNIYNPLSMASSLNSLCSGRIIDEEELFRHRELWRHFDFDSEKCHLEKKEFLSSINSSLYEAQQYIKKADNLFLTLGTSFVYREKNRGIVVNNCHKLPSDRFSRENASIDEMKNELLSSLINIKKMNKNIKITMTLSPVRHLRDSALENSLSKARLRCLIEELSEEIDLRYFPAYEIMIDQLRDYRWYEEDLAHPTNRAVNYIMDRFIQATADNELKTYLTAVEKLNRSLNHRILHVETEEAKKFLNNLKTQFTTLIRTYPQMSSLEKRYHLDFQKN